MTEQEKRRIIQEFLQNLERLSPPEIEDFQPPLPSIEILTGRGGPDNQILIHLN